MFPYTVFDIFLVQSQQKAEKAERKKIKLFIKL